MRGIRLAVLLLSLASPVGRAWAAPVSPKAQAVTLYDEGVALFKAKKFAEAREKFQAAYNLDPAANLLYNLARAAEEMGDASAAVGHYRAYIARFPNAADRGEVERRIRVLEAVERNAKKGTLTLTNVPQGAKVELNGKAMPTQGPWRLDPGKFIVKFVTPGEPAVTRTVVIRSAQTFELDYAAKPKAKVKLAPKPKFVEPTPKPETPPGPPPEAGFWNGMTISGVSLVGGGVVLATVGGVFYGKALDDKDAYDAATKEVRATNGSEESLARRAQAQDDYESNGTLSIGLLIAEIGRAHV